MWIFRKKKHHHLPTDALFVKLTDILKTQVAIMAELTRLQAAVDANTKATSDVTALVAAIPAPAAPVDQAAEQAAVDGLATQVETNNAALAGIKAPA